MSGFTVSAARPVAALMTTFAVAVVAASSVSAAPPVDAQGYVDSTARCGTPATVVLFGSTDSSRVAICKSSGGQFEYRGVRLRDGADLVLPATQSGDGYSADNDGVTYTVTAKSLAITQGGKVIREETMVDFHRPDTQAPPPAATTPATTSPPTPTPTTPLPPPLPAEVGGTR